MRRARDRAGSTNNEKTRLKWPLTGHSGPVASFLSRRRAQLDAEARAADAAEAKAADAADLQYAPLSIDEDVVAKLADWFATYSTLRNVYAPASEGPYSCPCCGHVTLAERGGYEICDECGWEDDGQDDHDADVARNGPNGGMSLEDARAAYVEEGGILLPHLPPAEPT